MKTLTTRLLLVVVLALLGTVSAGFAQLLNENFDYGASDNSDITVATSNWLRHSGAQGPTYKAAGLVYTDYASSGVGGSVGFTFGSSGTNDGDANRSFTSVTSSSTIYASFIVSLSVARTTADYFFHLGPGTIGSTFRGRVFARSNGAGWSLGLSKSSEARVDDITVLNLNQTYLLVLKYEFNTTAANDDQVTLYAYDTGVPASEPGTPLLTIGPTGTGVASDPSEIGSVAIRQGSNTPTGTVDGIRVGTSWNDAPLPVQISSFTGTTLASNSVRLNWTTVSEVNNYGFYVEKRSHSESGFTEIPNSFIAGHGTTNLQQHYTYVDDNAGSGMISYRLRQRDLDGAVHFTEPILVNGVTSVNQNVAKVFALQQNYPNPFNPETQIKFSVESAGKATLRVFNLIGQDVATLFNDNAEAGKIYTVNFGGAKLPSGMYFYKLESGNKSQLRKMMLIK